MASCWSSVMSVLGGGPGDTEEETQLRGSLLGDKAAAASEAKAVEKLEAEVKALVRALAAAERDREAAEARRREAETLAGKAVADLRAAEEDHQGRVDDLLRMADESKVKDARIRELEEKIKAATGMTEAPSPERKRLFFF
jgi:chromosome segregation ATPase